MWSDMCFRAFIALTSPPTTSDNEAAAAAIRVPFKVEEEEEQEEGEAATYNCCRRRRVVVVSRRHKVKIIEKMAKSSWPSHPRGQLSSSNPVCLTGPPQLFFS